MTVSVEEILDQVHGSLLAGDLASMSGLESRLATAADRLPVLDPASARRLQMKAERNARLLQAASRGLRSALERGADIARGPMLSTYDSKGRKAVLPGPEMALGRF
jgi:hypothetical protein